MMSFNKGFENTNSPPLAGQQLFTQLSKTQFYSLTCQSKPNQPFSDLTGGRKPTMIIKTLTRAILLGGIAIGLSSTANAADKPKLLSGASATMLSNTCAGCHGTNGASGGPATPTIAGLSTEYFIEVMQAFKANEVPSTIMTRIAKGYSDAEFKAMAEYFGKKPFVKAKGQKFDAKMAATGAKIHEKYCEKCHADGGTKAEDDSGILAGQWSPYVRWTMADFLGGDREMTKKMKKKVTKLTEKYGDKGFEALYHFYASQQ